MLQSTIRTSPKILIMKIINEVVKAIVTTGYCLHIILYGPNLIIRLRFDVVPNTELRPKHRTALNPPPARPSYASDSQSPYHLNIFNAMKNIQRNTVYLQSFFNYAINVILARFTLRPLYSRERTHWISVCMSLDDEASCGLYFSSVSRFWNVFYYHMKGWMC